MKGQEQLTPWVVALCGHVALALIMGIGRFAFTPILPMMQEDHGVSIAQGGWLASANYFGYLAGALWVVRVGVRPRFVIRMGLVAIAAATIAMGIDSHFVVWMVLRFIPGFASACVMVYVSAWSLERLAQSGRSDLAGVVYAGVGAGIIFAGLACLALLQIGASSDAAWVFLGIAACVITVAIWSVGGDERKATNAQPRAEEQQGIPEFWRLVFCNGAFGLGYIIPATFLPVMAKQIVANPAWFGWAWPAFGAAAVGSTLLAAKVGKRLSDRSIWVAGNLIMALGVLVPIALPDLVGIAIAALCVGGTFMVNTMVALREARRVAGAQVRVLMASMISAFAVGQIVGPLLVSWLERFDGGFSYALVASAVPLLIAAYTLFMNRDTTVKSVVATSR